MNRNGSIRVAILQAVEEMEKDDAEPQTQRDD
jgi:hypothetical protein